MRIRERRHRGTRAPGLALALGVAVVLPRAPVAAAQEPSADRAAAQPVVYTILPAASLLQVHTGKGGLLGGLGHEHDVRAHAYAGTVVYDPEDPSRSRVTLIVPTDSLEVVIADDSSDIPEITEAMRRKVLRVDSFPEIRFSSTGVTVRDSTLHLLGDLTMAGVTRPVEVDLVLGVTPQILHARGSFAVKQTDFGIRPYSAALGTIKVKNEVTFTIDVRALAAR